MGEASIPLPGGKAISVAADGEMFWSSLAKAFGELGDPTPASPTERMVVAQAIVELMRYRYGEDAPFAAGAMALALIALVGAREARALVGTN